MSKGHSIRAYKICRICGEGYDAFKALDARGRYCSPACLVEARRRHRLGDPAEVENAPPVGPAVLPPVVSLGSFGAMVRLDAGFEGETRRLI